MKEIRSIAVIGTGLVASGMATLFIANGYDTKMLGISPEECGRGLSLVRANLDDLVQAGVLPGHLPERFLKKLSFTLDYADLTDADFAVEAVFERAEVKHSVYRELEKVLSPDAVITSVTSAIPPDVLAEPLARKDRFLVAHPWNPPHLIPLVEAVRGKETSDGAVETLLSLYGGMGRKVVVLRKAAEGFIGNRLQHALYREALHLVEEGIASPEEIDQVMLSCLAPRFSSVGLLEYFDSCGLDLHYDVQSKLYPSLCAEAAPQKLVTDAIARGDLGMKTGRGLLEWDEEKKAALRRRKSEPFYRCFVWKE